MMDKIKTWIPESQIEDSAMEQIIAMSTHHHLFKHVAIMPDVHYGIGATIGSVLPMKGCVIPSAVGMDIGCGMGAVKTSIKAVLNDEMLIKINREIKKLIPVGFKGRGIESEMMDKIVDEMSLELFSDCYQMDEKYYNGETKTRLKLGTLGGGNHFIELQRDEDNFLWIMVHSGSRHIGALIAKRYMAIAKDIREKYKIDVPTDLGYLAEGTTEFYEYINDMNFAIKYAHTNRAIMLNLIKCILTEMCHCEFASTINIAHNYASKENHFGQNVWVHRKGATRVRDNITGIVPGSMGTNSYIVKGTNNEDSYHSCAHGAGRTMSRTKARAELNFDDFRSDMSGVYSTSVRSRNIDEAPRAYKDINDVMENQKELVKVIHTLKPILNVKGDNGRPKRR